MRAEEFGQRLSDALRGSGLPKLRFANKLQAKRTVRESRGEPPLRKVDRSALYAFLQGRDFPPVDTLAEMAELLGVRLAWLAEGEEPVERDLDGAPPPIWLIDGHRGPWKRPSVPKRFQARTAFEEHFFRRSEGYLEAEPVVRRLFAELLSRRLARRRTRGDRGPSDPEYRAKTARGLYLKCFLDVADELPDGTAFSSPVFTGAFLFRVSGWMRDEMG
jgi:transcriptional regulator with XRE-family HTH domain